MKQATDTSEKNSNAVHEKNQENKIRFEIMQTAEFHKKKKQFSYHGEMLQNLSSIRYCKAEVFENCIIGSFRLPQKKEEKTAALTFGFYLTEQTVVFVEDGDKLKTMIQKHLKSLPKTGTPAEFLLAVLELMTEDDLLYLLQIESKAGKMEDDIENGMTKDFFPILTKYRQKLSELNSYYEQLADIGEFFQSASCALLIQNEREWGKFTRRVERLQNHVNLLRENMLQLRELYQSAQDAKQNRIIGILTVVTTFFLPLTLLTGWYGMNFVHMPELQWRYGYVAVIVVAVVIAVWEFIQFKKKKFF